MDDVKDTILVERLSSPDGIRILAISSTMVDGQQQVRMDVHHPHPSLEVFEYFIVVDGASFNHFIWRVLQMLNTHQREFDTQAN